MAHCEGFRPGCTNEATQNKLFVAVITCKQFATFIKPTRPLAIVAVSYDEAMGKAIAQAKRVWSNERYSEHTADIQIVPQDAIEQVRVAGVDAPPLLERLAALLSAARAYRDAWAGTSLPMGPLACGAYWERLRSAIEALDEREISS